MSERRIGSRRTGGRARIVDLLVAGGAVAGGAGAGVETCVSLHGGELAADVDSVTIQPVFELNGAPFPVSAANAARISLVRDGFVQVVLGETDLAPVPTRVLAGAYDLIYEHKAGPLVPRNGAAIFAHDVPVVADGQLVVNVPSVVQSGDFLLDGAPFPGLGSEDGLISARRTDTGDEVLLGNTHDGSYSLALVPGEYEIVYGRESGGSVVPHNSAAVVDTRAIVATDLSADVAVTSVAVTGDFLFNGGAPPNLAFDNGEIRLRTPAGDEVLLGETRDQSYSARVVPGSYDVYYDVVQSTGTAPQNHDKLLLEQVSVGAGKLDVDVVSRIVVGDFTRNGVSPPAVGFENGSVSFVDRATGAEIVVGETADQSYSKRLCTGSYDLLYRVLAASTLMPVNDAFTLDRVTVPASGLSQVEIDVEIPMTTLTVDSTLDGAAWPADTSHGELRLHGADGTPSLTLGSTLELPFEVPVVSGEYRLGYSRTAGKDVPLNVGALLDDPIEVDGTADAEELDAVSVQVTLEATLDGAPFPASPAQAGRILLSGPRGVVDFGPTSSTSTTTKILPGVYDLLYAHHDGTTVPQNFVQAIGCVELLDCLFCDGFESGDTDQWDLAVP